MEEILQNLIKSYSGNKPQKNGELKKFNIYSNLSITQPIQRQSEFGKRILDGVEFLSEKVRHSKIGLQSYALSKDLRKVEQNLPENKEEGSALEIYTSLLALDILSDMLEDDSNLASQLNPQLFKSLLNFILDSDNGVSTFGIFKEKENPNVLESIASKSDSSSSSSGCSSHSNNEFDLGVVNEEEKHGNASDLGFNSLETLLPQDEHKDDCNTTALAMSVFLKEGIIDIKPVSSVTELLLSNVEDSTDFHHPKVIRAFLSGNNKVIDAVTCVNVLYLYYTLTEDNENEINSQEETESKVTLNYCKENVESTQNFLLETLNNLLTREDQQNQEQIEFEDKNETNSFFGLHPSQDSLLYFLSKCTTISKQARNRFAQPLVSLLDKRVDGSCCFKNGVSAICTCNCGPLNLAMRILAADALGLLSPEGNWIHRKLEADCCKLAKLQDESNGSWPIDSLFKIKNIVNNQDVYFGGREISTLFASRALQVFSQSEKNMKLESRMYKDFLY